VALQLEDLMMNVVLATEPSRELCWLGRLWGIPKLFDGEHSLTIERLDANRVRFVQQEVFSGILVSLLGGTLNAAERSFGEMCSSTASSQEGRRRRRPTRPTCLEQLYDAQL
jgi:hypothetical protein